MRKSSIALMGAVWAAAAVGCSGSAKPWVGTYKASWASSATFTSPAGMKPASYTDNGVIAVTDQGNSKVQMSWQVGNNAPSGTILFTISGDAAAVASGTGVGGTCWTGRLSNGAMQTSCCDICSAKLSGDTLVQEQTGHFNGTLNGAPYSGHYTGTWTGTRVKN